MSKRLTRIDDRKSLRAIGLVRDSHRPDSALERMVFMIFGGDFFKIFNFVIQLIRLIAEIFGDDDAKKEVEKSRQRTANSDPNQAC